MDSFSYRNTGNLALVNPLQAQGTVVPTAPENLGPRVLELSSILQTTLDGVRNTEPFVSDRSMLESMSNRPELACSA